MFHTEELKQVIDQLQSSHGASLGYFDTLLLIAKLIGLCAGPILFVFAVFAVLYFVPKYLPQILIPLEKDMNPYYFLCSWGYKNLNDLHFEGIRFTKKYKAILEKRGHLRYQITTVLSLIACFLLSPFLFVSFGTMLTYITVVCIFLYWIVGNKTKDGYYLTTEIDDINFRSLCHENHWAIYGNIQKLSSINEIESNIKEQLYKEVFSLKKDKVEMTPIEFEKYMDEHIVSDCCSIRFPFPEI